MPSLAAGLQRLAEHLIRHTMPITLATSGSSEALEKQLASAPCLHQLPLVATDPDRKPGPLLAAALKAGVLPGSCLALTLDPDADTLKEATDAGMYTVGVLRRGKLDKEACSAAHVSVSSLLDLDMHELGLQPFTDWEGDVLPLAPIRTWKGPVIKGFGRGSKMLGIPTANLDAELCGASGDGVAPGIYVGWASVGADPAVYKMVMSVGWNPYFDNKTKTVEPWLLHDFPEDFYDEELRLVVNGYMRPEANFTTLEALIEQIHHDGDVARTALDVEPFAATRAHPFLKPSA